MKAIMLYNKNPFTGNWLCWIPDTTQAYYFSKGVNKKEVEEFCDKVNNAFHNAELKIDKDGKVVRNL